MPIDDVYELKCQPTTDNISQNKNVLVPYKTNSNVYKDLTFDTLMDSLIFQIVLAVFLMFIFYNFGKKILIYIKTQTQTASLLRETRKILK